MATVEAVEHGPDLVLGVLADGMARQALMERLLALRHVLCRRRACRCNDHGGGHNQRPHHQYLPIASGAGNAGLSPSPALAPPPFKRPRQILSTANFGFMMRGLAAFRCGADDASHLPL
jgi:hypothetical protein